MIMNTKCSCCDNDAYIKLTYRTNIVFKLCLECFTAFCQEHLNSYDNAMYRKEIE